MKLGKYILRAVLFLLAALMIGAGFYLYPAWKAAKAVQDKMSLPYKAFELKVELDREEMPAEQTKLFGTLAKLTGIGETSFCRWTIRGSCREDRIHLTAWPGSREEPLFELYLSDDTDLINESMVYNAIRNHLAGQLGLLGHLMPVQEETLYLTLGQVEQLFGTDLSGLRELRLQTADRSITAKEYFLLLAVSSREKQGNGYRFLLDTKQAGICVEISLGQGDAAVRLECQIHNLADVIDRADSVLPWLEKWLPGEKMQGVKSLSLTLEPQESGEIVMPTNLANQNIIDTIAKIREWIQKTFGGGREADDATAYKIGRAHV